MTTHTILEHATDSIGLIRRRRPAPWSQDILAGLDAWLDGRGPDWPLWREHTEARETLRVLLGESRRR
jgi:hypothetical protein